ncbi:CDP-alcohol phosphatidyltransferase family protein [Nocardioides sp.]|uniref:CDP-alcohol phosphatidyltransferase family protein n=1 Tax=Nocardioides sp. TaxID=35761 RepID=UPI002ED5D4A7
MVPVGRALVGALVALAGALVALTAGPGLHPVSWCVGVGAGALVVLAVARAGSHEGHLTPADLVTLTRVMLACAVAALVVESWLGRPATLPLVALATIALVLDAVDGRVARATRRTTGFGARFDGEADAFLLLVVSAHVAVTHGAWVLAIGLARYVFWAAGSIWPWLRHPLPRRDWRKVVTAVQGIVLVVAAADVAPRAVVVTALAGALALLAESFGRDVWWLVRHRHGVRLVGVSSP